METEKWRSKALKTASEEKGVSSVSVDGDNKLVVIGDNVNIFCLLNQLGKKFCCPKLLTVEELKPPAPAPEPKKPKEKSPCDDGDDGGNNPRSVPTVPPPCPWHPHYHYHPGVVVVYDSYNDGYGNGGCSIS
ncbi:hypothetical protein PIB30_005788 [Stylosanthes scabra]|uniref:Uncharacterized protein n=1 Tax=Stylosanthes scabra TaxID=79078 RepID=A0ABU6X1F0_9FABA|nr:hypothetical protein [Stylosanthes scabra]